ncbi:helix-turn-helix transcriptional regulator [Streptomyces scabiei]|uniref:helix-turn-helix domain-containing protein n=1 Tax=Streptomyces scabiei TaxID=1930 RepID=UPI0029AF0769|nr:helix-turn-helix transcriptional regulator [Streptomyces scabiei]MDX3520766.1 helix-turn-helix transcriptional regulator [Streptomyces scabiei]
MTTTVREDKLPPHGSQARYRGNSSRPPCHCPRCVRGWTQAGQRREMLRLAGKPASLTQAEVSRVVAHLQACRAAGMSQRLISRRAGVAQSTISRLLNNPTGCLRSQGDRILAVRIGDFDSRSDRPATGTIRRIQALYYDGHGPLSITVHAPLSLTLITEIAGGTYTNVAASTEDAIKAACAALAGIAGASRRTRQRALREGWAPLSAWDDIDDPDAVPDWTGCCGTDRGWWMHSLNGIPVCRRCAAAHTAWLAERRDLPAAERFRQLAQARVAASSRSADLAHDARELMRVSGLTREQAAERLGVHKSYVDQAFLAHPEYAIEVPA